MAENPMTAREYSMLKRGVRVLTRLQTPIYKLTRGRLCGTLFGKDVCLVTMTGAKSGKRITRPVMYVPSGQDVLVIGSLGGAPKSPLWVKNLLANPDVEIQHRGEKRKLRARLAGPEEKERLWPTAVEHYPAYADYQARTDRDIPLFVCEPASN
ncbi:MAG: nitroreductase family deazaflavin-dependent oxidoreductase [Deltaproteobacteria bacterium]|nr:nitroreductase family deazaflavin-dependent oxidoreductase [Deltaproteobacteria bacterium]